MIETEGSRELNNQHVNRLRKELGPIGNQYTDDNLRSIIRLTKNSYELDREMRKAYDEPIQSIDVVINNIAMRITGKEVNENKCFKWSSGVRYVYINLFADLIVIGMCIFIISICL